MAVAKSAPTPVEEVVPAEEVAPPASPVQENRALQIDEPMSAPPGVMHFVGVNGITDGANHYGVNDHFIGSETLVAHYERTGGYDGKRQLYRPISAATYERAEAERTAAILDVELPPMPPTRNQVVANGFTDLPPVGEAPIGARPGQGAGFTANSSDNGMAGSTGSA